MPAVPRPIDQPTKAVWYNDVTDKPNEDGNGNRIPGKVLSDDDIRDTWGPKLVTQFVKPVNIDLRKRYYNLSFNWHDRAFKNGGGSGGQYGEQWCRLFEQYLSGVPHLGLTDFANLHAYLIFTLRRAIFDQTAHDIDGDSETTMFTKQQAVAGGGGVGILSFHMVPNDGPDPSMRASDMSLSTGQGA